MTDIYAQHRVAFANVSAYVVLKDGERVATVAFKFPKDGAGRVYAYVHWIGVQMVRGMAAGGGYDKQTAACAHATRNMPATVHNPDLRDAQYLAFKEAMRMDDGYSWDRQLEKAGFTVLQAV